MYIALFTIQKYEELWCRTMIFSVKTACFRHFLCLKRLNLIFYFKKKFFYFFNAGDFQLTLLINSFQVI